jgi:hypothetical protein
MTFSAYRFADVLLSSKAFVRGFQHSELTDTSCEKLVIDTIRIMLINQLQPVDC